MNKLLRRELEVAFHRNAQPIWLRVFKYVVIGTAIYWYGGSSMFWWILAAVTVAGSGLHLVYRHKTRGWTRSYGRGFLRWDYDRTFGSGREEPAKR